ncbi:MAG: SUMF1/EgtB/PvdO family nonheme iron enzyme [Acidobacteriota bacterium]
MAANRVIRGGSWNNNADNCRSANRNRNTPGNRNNNVGFRLSSTWSLAGGASSTDEVRVQQDHSPGRSSRAGTDRPKPDAARRVVAVRSWTAKPVVRLRQSDRRMSSYRSRRRR